MVGPFFINKMKFIFNNVPSITVILEQKTSSKLNNKIEDMTKYDASVTMHTFSEIIFEINKYSCINTKRKHKKQQTHIKQMN